VKLTYLLTSKLIEELNRKQFVTHNNVQMFNTNSKLTYQQNFVQNWQCSSDQGTSVIPTGYCEPDAFYFMLQVHTVRQCD
jgi:hypothetical protein